MEEHIDKKVKIQENDKEPVSKRVKISFSSRDMNKLRREKLFTNLILHIEKNTDIKIIKELLDEFSINDINQLYQGCSILSTIIRNIIFYVFKSSKNIIYREEIIKYIIEKGADINIQESFTMTTPLFRAVKKKNERIMKLLLDYGANPMIKDSNDKSILTELIEDATLFPIIDYIKDVNYYDKWGYTYPLREACLRTWTTIGEYYIEKLLEKGAKNLYSPDGTAFQIFMDNISLSLTNTNITKRFLKIIHLFLENGADVMEKDKNGDYLYKFIHLPNLKKAVLWNHIRLLYIAFYKTHNKSCPMSLLPLELIEYIIQFI